MKKNLNLFISILILILTFIVFYFYESPINQIPKDYLGILIFFFATITGVFIARQGRRYNLIVKGLTDFNGNLSFQYRDLEMFEGNNYQKKFGEIVKLFYSHLEDKSYSWDWFLKSKTSLLTDINKLHIEIINNEKLNQLQSHFINRSQASLLDMHKIRKNLVPFINESIPKLQWSIILLLAFGLLISIFSFNSQNNLFESILKALFTTSIFSVLMTLYRMNKLNFYEEKPGESSAKDVLENIKGEK